MCGTSILPSDEVVGEELEAATDHLKAGLLYYKPYTKEDHDLWAGKTKLKENQQSFIARVAKMLVCRISSLGLHWLMLKIIVDSNTEVFLIYLKTEFFVWNSSENYVWNIAIYTIYI